MIKLNENHSDLGELVLRVFTGFTMIALHGLPKLTGFGDKMGSFPDPLGISSTGSLAATVFAEVFCQIFIILGIKTRWFAGISFFTMMVAAFIVHAGDPWMRKEKAILYAIIYLSMIFSNGGKLSIKN